MEQLTNNTTNMSEFELDKNSILKIRTGDALEMNALLNRYQKFVYSKARPYFLVGAERDDIIQEGMIGLYNAIKNFDTSATTSFKSFADLCIRRQIITAIKTSTRQKHMPLNSYLSLSKTTTDEENDRQVIETIPTDVAPDPLEMLTIKETYATITKTMGNVLSSFEKQVYCDYINGLSYEQMAKHLNTHEKAVDNAIQRIRRKIDRYIDSQEIEL